MMKLTNVFGFIRKSKINLYLTRAVEKAIFNCTKIHDEEVRYLKNKFEDEKKFLTGEKDSEIETYLKQIATLKLRVRELEKKDEMVEREATINRRVANDIDNIMKNIFDAFDKSRACTMSQVQNTFDLYYEQLGRHLKRVSEVYGDAERQYKKLVE